MSRRRMLRQSLAAHALRLGAAIVLLALGASVAGAQDSADARPAPWMVGGSVGTFAWRGELAPMELSTIGISFTQVHTGRLGADVAIGTIPRLLTVGMMPIAMRAGIALPVAAAPGVLLLPSTGISLLGIAGEGGAGGLAGYNLGGAAVLGAGRVGLRVGLTSHWMLNAPDAIWLLEVGIVGRPAHER